jgi:hypothetical protein
VPPLTRDQIGSLCEEIRKVRGRCLQRSVMLDQWLAKNPEVDPVEARFFCSVVGKSPFPVIDAPRPKYRDRPFFDARFEGEWSDG